MPIDIANAKALCNSICLCQDALAGASVARMSPIAITRRNNLRILEQQYGSQAALAEAVDVSPGYVNQMLSGHRPIGEKSARRMEEALGFDVGWFDQLRSANMLAEASEVADLSAGALVAQCGVVNTEAAPPNRGKVPLISWVRAGEWMEAIDNYHVGEADEWLPCLSTHGPRTFALRVRGDSMTASYGRTYPDGCLIYVDPDQRGGVVSGDRVIARLDGSDEVTFKVFVDEAGHRFLKPLNPQYPIIREPFEVLGRIVCKVEIE